MNHQTTPNHIASRYDRHAALEQEVCSRLLERTAFQQLAPVRIFDLGCGTGAASAELKRMFRKAQVLGLDSSLDMLMQMRRKSRLLKPLKSICGDMCALPFADQSADLIFSNLAAHWIADPSTLFAELRRVLKPDGMLLFSTLGPASMPELHTALSALDDDIQMPAFPDVMEVGDALLASGFRQPVMDVDTITLHYPDLTSLAEELEATGTSMLIRGWSKRKEFRDRLAVAFEPVLVEGKHPLSYEVIYGTAFGPPDEQVRKTDKVDVVTISVDSLLKSRPMSYD